MFLVAYNAVLELRPVVDHLDEVGSSLISRVDRAVGLAGSAVEVVLVPLNGLCESLGIEEGSRSALHCVVTFWILIAMFDAESGLVKGRCSFNSDELWIVPICCERVVLVGGGRVALVGYGEVRHVDELERL